MTESTNRIVYVVDDDRAVRDSLVLMLRGAGYQVRGLASAGEFLNEWRPHELACLVLDVRMPGRSGLELQDVIRERGSSLPVIFVSGHGDVPVSVRAIKGGALDFLEKPFPRKALLERVEEAFVVAEKASLDAEGRRHLMERFSSLTPREQQVMSHVVAGMQNKEIAKRLRISHRTVELHRTHMMEKMCARTLPELVAMAVRCGVCEIANEP